jgi:hypothetical protein
LSTDAKTYATAYAMQLSRVALSLAAGVTAPSMTLVDYPSNSRIRGSQVPLAPLLAFVVTLLLFTVCVLAIGLGGNTKGPQLKDWRSRDVHAVKLAQLRLTSADPIIYEMFCAANDDVGRSGSKNAAELFRGHGNPDRIRVGIMDRLYNRGDDAQSRFGISTGVMRRLDGVTGTVVL